MNSEASSSGGALPDLEFLNSLKETPNVSRPMNDYYCRDFAHHRCWRGFDCRFIHKFVYCWNYQNNKECIRRTCKYMHVSHKDAAQYIRSRVTSQTLKREAERTLQNYPELCRDYANRTCRRGEDCTYKHASIGQTTEPSCGICLETIVAGKMARLDACNHIFCRTCVSQIEHDSWMRVDCPYCRALGRIEELN